MCYNINYLTKKVSDYARRLQGLIDIPLFEKDFEHLRSRTGAVYYTGGFDHPDVPLITNTDPGIVQLFSWGLIPFWVKDPKKSVELSNRTLNARGEEMFDKPSFRNSAMKKRCLILVDGFFEYHWHNDTSFPFYIKMKDDQPMLLGGLWETWHYAPQNMIRNTFSIVTTKANPMMSFIHNQPKSSEGPRMPVIVPRGGEKQWLMEITSNTDKNLLLEMIQPFDDSQMDAYTVARLKGKNGVGNTKKAIEKLNYQELL